MIASPTRYVIKIRDIGGEGERVMLRGGEGERGGGERGRGGIL